MRYACLITCFASLLIAQVPRSLSEVHTIFVDSLGQDDSSSIIRDKIIGRLSKSVRFQVVLEPDKADAVLTGNGRVDQIQRYSNGSGGTRYDATLAVRLITSDKRILWTSETKNNRFARSASSSVADHIVKDLLKAAQ